MDREDLERAPRRPGRDQVGRRLRPAGNAQGPRAGERRRRAAVPGGHVRRVGTRRRGGGAREAHQPPVLGPRAAAGPRPRRSRPRSPPPAPAAAGSSRGSPRTRSRRSCARRSCRPPARGSARRSPPETRLSIRSGGGPRPALVPLPGRTRCLRGRTGTRHRAMGVRLRSRTRHRLRQSVRRLPVRPVLRAGRHGHRAGEPGPLA